MNLIRRIAFVFAFTFLLASSALALSACGGASDEELEKAREQGAEEQKQKQEEEEQKERQEELEKKIEKLEKQAKKKNSSSNGSDSGGTRSSTAARYCGDGLGAGANTTCAFAENVRSEWASAGGGSVTIEVYSPVTGATYTMRCVDAPTTVCRGGNNAVVYIY